MRALKQMPRHKTVRRTDRHGTHVGHREYGSVCYQAPDLRNSLFVLRNVLQHLGTKDRSKARIRKGRRKTSVVQHDKWPHSGRDRVRNNLCLEFDAFCLFSRRNQLREQSSAAASEVKHRSRQSLSQGQRLRVDDRIRRPGAIDVLTMEDLGRVEERSVRRAPKLEYSFDGLVQSPVQSN